MNKSPEEYFQEQDFSVDVPSRTRPGEFTATELAFMEKYMGVDAAPVLRSLGIDATETKKDTEPAGPALEDSLDAVLRSANQLLMVGFFLGNQEFVIPTLAVQEVIKYSTPARLPAAPSFVAGIINQRGKITPLIRLRDLLGIPLEGGREHKFTIICQRRGLQMGLLIDEVRTMYRVAQRDIDWRIETHLGAGIDFISGLLKVQDKLVSIVSVDKIVEVVVKQ